MPILRIPAVRRLVSVANLVVLVVAVVFNLIAAAPYIYKVGRD